MIVGGCTNYKTALHLMRTGAAGVIVGIGADEWSTTDTVLGIRVPMATAIADAAAARRDYLDETGGRYVHLIADGDMQTSRRHRQGAGLRRRRGDARRAAVALRRGAGRRRRGGTRPASHPKLPRGAFGVRPRSRSARWRSCSTARATTRTARSTCSAGCAGPWPSAATATSRSSRRSASSWTADRVRCRRATGRPDTVRRQR